MYSRFYLYLLLYLFLSLFPFFCLSFSFSLFISFSIPENSIFSNIDCQDLPSMSPWWKCFKSSYYTQCNLSYHMCLFPTSCNLFHNNRTKGLFHLRKNILERHFFTVTSLWLTRSDICDLLLVWLLSLVSCQSNISCHIFIEGFYPTRNSWNLFFYTTSN